MTEGIHSKLCCGHAPFRHRLSRCGRHDTRLFCVLFETQCFVVLVAWEAITFGRSQEPNASEVQNLTGVLLRWEANRYMSEHMA